MLSSRTVPRVIKISFVRCEGKEVTGWLEPYPDPETGETTSTTFEGVLEGAGGRDLARKPGKEPSQALSQVPGHFTFLKRTSTAVCPSPSFRGIRLPSDASR